jgi:hypothetical protein
MFANGRKRLYLSCWARRLVKGNAAHGQDQLEHFESVRVQQSIDGLPLPKSKIEVGLCAWNAITRSVRGAGHAPKQSYTPAERNYGFQNERDKIFGTILTGHKMIVVHHQVGNLQMLER